MIAITGFNGYIGQHISNRLSIQKIPHIGIDISPSFSNTENDIDLVKVFHENVLDTQVLTSIFKSHSVTKVIHLAGLKSVRESNFEKARYFENNVLGTQSILYAMKNSDVKNLFFASTAGVYEYDENVLKYSEDHSLRPSNYYAETKLECELLIKQNAVVEENFEATIFRFFNVAGAFSKNFAESNGENIFPVLLKSIRNSIEFEILGSDYPTRDGTAVRDYIHIEDLIDGIMLALSVNKNQKRVEILNLGSESGTSVLELVEKFNLFFENKISIRLGSRRVGDVPNLLADSRRAQSQLGWVSSRTIDDIVKSYI